MKEIKLLTYWQYDIDSKEFDILLKKLNVVTCTYLCEDKSNIRKHKGFRPIYLYSGLKFYENADITYELDDEIVKKMFPYECTAMDIVNRWRRSYSFKDSYSEIKRIYKILLRYWNNYILENGINMLILTIMPHIPCTYIPYALCQIYNIPTIVQGIIPFSKGKKINYILKPSIENMDKHWNDRFISLQEKYRHDDENTIPVMDELDRYFDQYNISNKGKDNVIYYNEKNRIADIISKYGERAQIYIKRKDYKILMNKLKYLFITRTQTNQFLKRIEKLEEEVDLNRKFYFFALHLQPEATTLPNGGTFSDQLMAVRLLAKNLPDDTYLYVKEHPSYWIQKGRLESVYESRSIQFYKEIKSLKNVKLIKHAYSSQELLQRCNAVVTITGTVGFEALFLDKPVLLFGHTFYENYSYVFSIKTAQECKKAIEQISKNKFKFDKKEMKIYLKSIEKYVVPMGANEKNFKDNGTPVVDKVDRNNIVNKITNFCQEYYS